MPAPASAATTLAEAAEHDTESRRGQERMKPVPANGASAPAARRAAPTATSPASAGERTDGRRRSAQRSGGGDVNPYAGAGTTSLNVRILVPLHDRYRRLVRELEDEGYKSSATEIFHALLHFGPSGTDEARELLRSWRAVLDADPPR